MRCDEFEKILEEELTKPYPEPAAAHLETCESCRSLAAELSAIRMGGHVLGERDAEELDAPEHVWTALRRQLEEEGIIREPLVRDYIRTPWWSVFQRPALAGAVLSLMVIAGVLAGYQRTMAPEVAARVKKEMPAVPTAAPTPATVSDELQSELNETVSGLPQRDAILATSLRRDIDLIDSSIAMCEKSVREQPGNEIAREYLYGAYQQKAELLDVAMNRGMIGGLQ